MLPGAEHVDELDVNHFGLTLLGVIKEFLGGLGEVVRGHLYTSTFRQKISLGMGPKDNAECAQNVFPTIT